LKVDPWMHCFRASFSTTFGPKNCTGDRFVPLLNHGNLTDGVSFSLDEMILKKRSSNSGKNGPPKERELETWAKTETPGVMFLEES